MDAEITIVYAREDPAREPHGTAADGERTYVEVTAFGRIRRERLVDWVTLGLIAEVLLGTCQGEGGS